MAAEPVVVLRDIVKTFRQGEEEIEVLKSITMEVQAGEFVALQGTSGSGKSTLLQIIGLLDRPTGGDYLLRGRDVAHLDDDELSDLRNRASGFIFQSFYLIPYASALDNVMLPGIYAGTPRDELRERALELLSSVGLADRADFRPAQLSGGQQQRVAMARALVNDPDLVLADEPTGQLDSRTSAEIMDLFGRINASGKTIILVTHDEPTASHARRRILLRDGRIADRED